MIAATDYPERRGRWPLFALLLGVAFLFRLWFGLCSEFWYEDELQIYLIGLKFFATGAWPYFGPDVTYGIQIPGALQGLVVAVPLYVWPVVEAPFVLLNALSFAALCLFAWYCRKRLPEVPAWIIWAWLLTAPWTLNYSTHVINPSYILPGSILFFVGLLEVFPFTRKGLITPQRACLMMGAALLWVMQFHMSWVLLVPYALLAFYFHGRTNGRGALLKSLAWFACGAALTGVFLAPTYLKFGYVQGAGGTTQTVMFNAGNLGKVFSLTEGVLARFLSLASFEIPRFIAGGGGKRLQFMKEELWLVPFVLLLVAVGTLQPIAMICLWFSKLPAHEDWKAIKYLTLGSVMLLYVSFLFSIKTPSSHTFYVLFPVVMLYSLYCWSRFLERRAWQKFAAVCLACGVIFHAGLALHNLSRHSMYINRSIPETAIRMKDPKVLGERRPGSYY